MIYHLSIKYDLNHHGSGQESYGNPTGNDGFSHIIINGQKNIWIDSFVFKSCVSVLMTIRPAKSGQCLTDPKLVSISLQCVFEMEDLNLLL